MTPGQVLQEGVVVEHTKDGVLVGRQANDGEVCPPHSSEHWVGGRRVFLAHGQAPILPAFLHVKKKGRK